MHRGASACGQRLRRTAGAILVVAFALGGAPAASAEVITYDGGDVPFYARITDTSNPPQIFHDERFAVVVFYRSPDCVPGPFDLLTFFDFPGPSGPGAFGCNPPTTEGFNIWQNGPGLDPAPTLSVTKGLGAVPVWFVPWSDLRGAVSDPKENPTLTMTELRSLPRLEGSASSFQQVLRPHGTNDVPMTSFVARGQLTDGRSFSVAGLFIEGVTIQTRITFS